MVYHLFKSTDNHINLKRVKTFILVILSLGLIYRGTRMYIMSCDQFFCYAILVGVYLIGYYIWSKFNLRCYELSTFIIGLFIFIKCFLIRLSFYGSLVDFITGLFVIAIVQFASVKIVNSKLYAGIIAAGSSIFLGFFTMAAFYVRSVGNPGMPFGEEVQAIMQTNPQEALEFVQTLFTSKQLFMGACILAFYMFLIYRVSVKNSTNVKFNRLQKIFIAGSVVMLCGVNYSLGVTQSIMAPIYSLVQGYSKSMEQMRYYQELRSNNSNIVATKESKGETYVVVIGESANKRHMSAYGYFRNTTPWLESLRENENAIFMENAYASYVHTVPALLNALTAANQYNQKVNFIEPSIVEVAKAAGFRTYWFSNQNRYGLIDNPLTIVADQADEVYWTPTSNRGPDGELVKLLDKKLSNLNPETNNLIIVHLIGSHESYIKRLPEGYNTSWQENGIEYFGDIAKDSDYMKSAVDPYDATIKYTDENLEKIYDLIKSRVNDLSAFVYVSDHGQDVFGRMNHNAATFNFEMARIPMITLISDNWKRRNEGMFEQMKLHSMSPYTTDCFYDYLVGLSGISTEIYEKEKDLTSESYNLTWDNSMIMWTDKNLQLQFYSKSSPHNLSEDTAKIRTDNLKYLFTESDKNYLAVACDSIGSVYEALDSGFHGVEINITPTEDKIMMGHYPELVLNMTFDEWLRLVHKKKIQYIWLDVKFKSPELIAHTLDELERLDKVYNLLVENHTGVERFYQPRADEMMTIKEYASAVSGVVMRQNANNISFWAEGYPFINSEVAPLFYRNIKFATFALPGFPTITDSMFKQNIENYTHRNILNDTRTKYVLIEPATIFYIKI